MVRTIWLPSWFPSVESPQNGDFIFRHAMAASSFSDIYIGYLQATSRVSSVSISKTRINDNLEVLISLNPIKSKSKILNLFRKIHYFLVYKSILDDYIVINGKPDLIHVHVSFRAGLIALWFKKVYKIPFVITEHWTLFTPEREDNFWKKGLLFKTLMKRIFKEAEYVLPVSDNLGNNLKALFPSIKARTIPNVVDPNIFYYKPKLKHKEFNFIHVSSLKKIKNPKSIISTFVRLFNNYPDTRLTIVGEVSSDLMEFAAEFNLSNSVLSFTGSLAHDQVAQKLQMSDVFLLFSFAENLPCVIAESLCCGIPIISTNIGGIPEMVTDENGILIEPGDEEALFGAMERMYKEHSRYDGATIASNAQALYNPSVVGSQIVEIYDKVLASLKN